MINIKVNDRFYWFPSSWDELSSDELMFLVSKILRNQSIKIIKLTLTLKILSLRVMKKDSDEIEGLEYFSVVDKSKYEFQISSYALDLISEKLNFLFNEKTEKDGTSKTYVESKLTKNLIPEFSAGNIVFAGPKQALSDITFHQFILSEHYFTRYTKTNDVEHLNKFIASLYNRKSEDFSEDNISVNAALIAGICMSKKIAIKLFYEGSKAFLSEKFPLVFTGGVKGKLTIIDGYMKVINSLSGNDVTKHDEIRSSKLYEVMYALNDLIEKNKQIKM